MEALTRGQLIVALAISVGFFLFCYFASPRKTVPPLICLIPFQPIDSRWGTLNVALVFVISIAFILRRRFQSLPLFGIFYLILAICLVSLGFAHQNTYTAHTLYIVNLLSAFLLFWVVYNFCKDENDLALTVRTLIFLNVFVLVYCGLQVAYGQFSFFGIEELSIRDFRQGDLRLSGPFGVGLTAEFFVLSILFFAYLLIHAQSGFARLGLYLLIACNLAGLVATANRGGFLVLIGAAGLFLMMFRKELGFKRVVTLTTFGSLLLVASSLAVLTYTQFDQMYDRLGSTELQSGVPDTRMRVWGEAVERISERPLIGHGPRFSFDEIPYKGYVPIQYPHNLYLYLLYTIGIAGLVAYLLFFLGLYLRFRTAAAIAPSGTFAHGFAKLGIIVLVAFLIDQIKVEFLRDTTVDYAHYVFTMFAIFLAIADSLVREHKQSASVDLARPGHPIGAGSS